MVNDLTVIYMTANTMPEHWVRFQLDHLKKASEGYSKICITRKEMSYPFDAQVLLDKDKKSYWNIYHQLLRGAKEAKTKFVAMAEDDTLYTREHFTQFRPKDNEVSYNRSRWSLFTWEARPMYCIRNRISNCSLIAPREYLIECLEERERRWPNGFYWGSTPRDDLVGEVGRSMVEHNLKVTVRNKTEWYSGSAIVQLNHCSGTDLTQKHKRKQHGQIKAYDIPYWGTAERIVNEYRGV